MALGWAEELVSARCGGEAGKEIGQRWCPGEGARPFGSCAGQTGYIAVWGEDVDVAGVEGRYGYCATPVDEVLGVFAYLTQCENVVGLLCDLVESRYEVLEKNHIEHNACK